MRENCAEMEFLRDLNAAIIRRLRSPQLKCADFSLLRTLTTAVRVRLDVLAQDYVCEIEDDTTLAQQFDDCNTARKHLGQILNTIRIKELEQVACENSVRRKLIHTTIDLSSN